MKDRNFWYVFFNHRYGFIPAAATTATACTLSSTDMPAACGGRPVAWLLATPAFGPARSILTIQGGNYTARSQVVVQLGGHTLTKVTTDDLGSFTSTVPLPASLKPAPLALTGKDGSRVLAQTPFLLESAYHPHVSISAASIRAGATIGVSGNGYPVLQALTVGATFSLVTGGTQTVQAIGKTDATGHFSIKLRVPAAANGATQLVASVPGGTARVTIKVAGAIAKPTPRPTP